ncbi:aldo/keto reductase [Synoicihabitans lomoniglobus]|uniref:Aldo/keto reductase n=1 Tax=Synoicihabitans lomoniglobus TaxID=2909285 RepID=A0AAE9ZUT2_9BACT|nr:aldo/keto reductase [Opitutaceae bacterium LMO-M01]WED63190.1 aldo/keto reductase [Opitutaceae bacterium LMO-M01]
MLYRPLAGLEAVSALCLGAGPFGSQLPAARAYDLLDAFVNVGGNFIDTAHIYGAWAPQGENGGCGNSEVTVGRWLRQNGHRDRMIVATKGGHPDFATGETRLTREGLRRFRACANWSSMMCRNRVTCQPCGASASRC